MFKEEPSCRLCLIVVNDENLVVIEETIKEVLDVLLLKLHEKEKNKSIMCNACSVKLFAAFNFKATCTDTEDRIFPYIDSERGTPVDLREIYLKERGKKHLKDVLEDERICRLCMQVVTCGFTPVKEVDVDTLCQYIPEVNLTSTTDPVVCKACIDSLDTHTSFLKGCFNVEEKIKNISVDKTVESLFHIITEKIELKSEDYNDSPLETSDDEPFRKSDCEDTKEDGCKHGNRSKNKYDMKKKQELNELYSCDKCSYKTGSKIHFAAHCARYGEDLEVYKCEMCDYKTENKKLLQRHQLRHKGPLQVQKYRCNDCDYETNKKSNINQHQLTHKDASQLQMYRCNDCDFETKYRPE
ncbi:RE1-silencing transcription factor B-like [Anoplophora glabripennis]|uniref:RE1-silencing transcription factor B-like n=1 Tax=Anoplophora glabripennis TaxID=217634 RepID=UPI0008745346|nr:RE1-silencing transcription factor B-like [Anoplophora glabripennis]